MLQTLRSLVMGAWAKLRRGDRVLIRQASVNGYQMLVRIDEEVGRQILYVRSYEQNESDLIRHLLRDSDICFDVGANLGYYTLLMASGTPSGKVHAFEPVALNWHLLGTSVHLNRLQNVVVNCCAVGHVPGERDFCISTDTAYSSFLDTGRKLPRTTTRVPVTTLDRYCEEHGIARIDLLKVDVEGAEGLVLQGAVQLLGDAARKPRVMMLELYDPMLARYGTSIQQLVTLLKGSGYKPFICAKGKVIPFSEEHRNKFYNVFFAPDW